MSSATIININCDASEPLLESSTKRIFFFWAPWHVSSSPGGAFDSVFEALAKENGSNDSIGFYRLEADNTLEICKKYNIHAIPTFLFLHTDGSIFDRIDGGVDVARVTQSYVKLRNSTNTTGEGLKGEDSVVSLTESPLHIRLRTILTSSPVMIFIKGSPDAPRCGFSRQACDFLTSANVSFGYFDILSDEVVRQGLKEYSDWPTYPQLYVRGELVGGLDIMKEMAAEKGGLVEQLNLGEFVIGSSTLEGNEAVIKPSETVPSVVLGN